MLDAQLKTQQVQRPASFLCPFRAVVFQPPQYVLFCE